MIAPEQIEIGDILIKKSYNIVGTITKHLFPDSVLEWSNSRAPKQLSSHNGIFGIHNDVLGVFEASFGQKFFFTPWVDYIKLLESGKCEVKIARYSGLDSEARAKMNWYLNSRMGKKIPYDVIGTLAVAFKSIFNRTLHRLDEHKAWYCTEVISRAFRHVGINIFPANILTPLDIERAVVAGTIHIISE